MKNSTNELKQLMEGHTSFGTSVLLCFSWNFANFAAFLASFSNCFAVLTGPSPATVFGATSDIFDD